MRHRSGQDPHPESTGARRSRDPDPVERDRLSADEGQEKLDRALDVLEVETPDWLCRGIRWLRDPKARWVRLPAGLALVIAGSFGFLPVLGYEWIPLGLLLIALDVPILRKPVATATLWLERKWIALRRRWRARHRQQ